MMSGTDGHKEDYRPTSSELSYSEQPSLGKKQCKDWLVDYLAFTSNTEPSVRFRTWAGLSCLAAATKGTIRFRWGHSAVYPNVWVGLIGRSGIGKNKAIEPAEKLLQIAWGKTIFKPYTGRITTAGLSDYLSKQRYWYYDPLEKKHLLRMPLHLIAPEASSLFTKDDYRKDLVDILAELYDHCETPEWCDKTKTQGTIVATRPFITLIMGATGTSIVDVIPRRSVGQGFMSRVTFIYTDKRDKIIAMPEWTAEHTRMQQALAHDLKRLPLLAGGMAFSPSGLDTWTQYYEGIPMDVREAQADVRMQPYASREPYLILKVAMLISLGRRDDKFIHTHDLELAMQLVKDAAKDLRYVYAGYGRDDNYRHLVELLETLKFHKEMSEAKLHQLTAWRWTGQRNFKEALDTLASLSQITKVTVGLDVKWRFVSDEIIGSTGDTAGVEAGGEV